MGVAIGWLMCNRQGLSIVVVPDLFNQYRCESFGASLRAAFLLRWRPPLIDLNFCYSSE